jgi:very-short-patch-repair endonuclease
VVARPQLVELGLDRNSIQHRLSIGRLHVLHRGVYAVGHRKVSATGREMAAVLACGPGAVLSHRAAAALWGLRPSSSARIDVTAPRQLGRRAGIRLRVSRLARDERTTVDGIPVTTVPRTLLDLATELRQHELERAIDQAEVLRLTDPLSLPALLERYPGRRGTATLRAALEEGNLGMGITRSELERRFLRLVTKARFPRPELNAPLHVAGRWIEVDCLWRAERVAVELDSRGVHGTHAAFERDRARDRRLQAGGWTPVRVTWRQLAREAQELEADLRTLLLTS